MSRRTWYARARAGWRRRVGSTSSVASPASDRVADILADIPAAWRAPAPGCVRSSRRARDPVLSSTSRRLCTISIIFVFAAGVKLRLHVLAAQRVAERLIRRDGSAATAAVRTRAVSIEASLNDSSHERVLI